MNFEQLISLIKFCEERNDEHTTHLLKGILTKKIRESEMVTQKFSELELIDESHHKFISAIENRALKNQMDCLMLSKQRDQLIKKGLYEEIKSFFCSYKFFNKHKDIKTFESLLFSVDTFNKIKKHIDEHIKIKPIVVDICFELDNTKILTTDYLFTVLDYNNEVGPELHYFIIKMFRDQNQ